VLKCSAIIENIIQDLLILGVITESFRIYGSAKPLKKNLVAKVQLNVLKIEDSLKDAKKLSCFTLCCEAYNVLVHIF